MIVRQLEVAINLQLNIRSMNLPAPSMRSKHMVIGLMTVKALRFSMMLGLGSIPTLNVIESLLTGSIQSLNDTAVGGGLFACTAT